MGGYRLSLLKISSESSYRTPGAGLAPLINALEPDKRVRPRQGASPYRRSWGTPAVTRLEYLSPVRTRTRRSRFSLATRGLVSFLSPGRSATRCTASVPVGTPRGRGAGFSLNLYLRENGPLRVEWGGAATPEAFPPSASYPEACSAALARPASLASAAATPPPRSLPEPVELSEPRGAPATAASSSLWFSPHASYFLIRGPSQPCGLAQGPPPHGARALPGKALPASRLPPLASPGRLLPCPCGPDS